MESKSVMKRKAIQKGERVSVPLQSGVKPSFTWGQIFKVSLFDLMHYTIDMCFVYTAFYLAWDVHLKSWAWLIGLGIFGRWIHRIVWIAGARK